MKTRFSFFVAVLITSLFLGSVSEAAFNCGSYGTSYSDTYLNPSGNKSSIRCPDDKPMTNSLITTSAGSHCCMTRANSDKFISDYNAAHGGSGTTTASASGTAATTSGSTCGQPNTCRNADSGCQPGENLQPSKTCEKKDGVNQVCCAPASGTGTGGGTGTGTGSIGGTSEVSITLNNQLKYDTVEEVLTSIMAGLRGIVVVLALLMIVIGGIMYILSAGNDGRMKVAKNIILAALIGLAIVIAAPAFLREISALLGWDNAPEIVGETQLTLTQIASNILKFLLSIIGILALIMMMVSGIMYLASGGNEARIKQAKAIFVASLIGITVAMGSLVLVTAVANFFVSS